MLNVATILDTATGQPLPHPTDNDVSNEGEIVAEHSQVSTQDVTVGSILLGAFNMRFLARERRFHISDKPLGYLGTLLVGIAFGAGWSPCIGPILGGILTYTATQAELQRGLVLLGAYSLGLAIPFVIAAVAVERFIAVFQRYRSKLIWVYRIAGALLIVVGVLMLTNYMTVLTGYLQGLTPSALRSRL